MTAKQRPDGLYDLWIGQLFFTGLTFDEVLIKIEKHYEEEK